MERSNETQHGYKGLLLHVFRNEPVGDYEVWWNLDIEFDGMCIGAGDTRQEAVNDAYRVLSGLSIVLDEAAASEPAQTASGG